MMVMIELLILILFYVQANDLAPTSFSSALPPTLLPYSFEFDDATGAMQKCLINRVGGCRNFKRICLFRDIKYEICVLIFFGNASFI
jgi:hypothetical protein